jgi:hypothetical protein
MAMAQKVLLFVVGVILGALASWGLALAYSALDIDHGFLALPFTLVAFGGFVLARRPALRLVAIGLVVGAAVETAFFIWLFAKLANIDF